VEEKTFTVVFPDTGISGEVIIYSNEQNDMGVSPVKRIRRGKCFTLIELIVVISIMGVLAGLGVPSYLKAKERARYVRWLAYNNQWNNDPSTVINYNFENTDFKLNYNGVRMPALYNSTTICDSQKFIPNEYHGILINGLEWKKGGRWRTKSCLQFNGRNSYVLVPGSSSIDFDPAKDDFTISTWINLDNTNGAQTFFSKCEWLAVAQYDAYINKNRFEADVGTGTAAWLSPKPEAGKWFNFVLTSEAGRYQLYINGKAMTNRSTANTNPSSTEKTSRPFILGAAGYTGKTQKYFFQGRMDELMVLKRSLSPAEIKGIYEMGTP
jgi:prepilin-type N-terminal cleavage/methylation domain-containing protein